MTRRDDLATLARVTSGAWERMSWHLRVQTSRRLDTLAAQLVLEVEALEAQRKQYAAELEAYRGATPSEVAAIMRQLRTGRRGNGGSPATMAEARRVLASLPADPAAGEHLQILADAIGATLDDTWAAA